MLTPVSCQVNAAAMVDVKGRRKLTRTAQQSLAVTLLQPLLERRRPERLLVLKHENATDLPLEPVSPVQIIRLSRDPYAEDVMLRGRLRALPFENAAFDLVVLQHLLVDGSEDEMQEAIRVLAPGGDLVINGLNSAGLHYRVGNRAKRFPGLKLNRIYYHLKNHSFEIEQCLRMGFAGMSKPLQIDRGYGFALPFADRVVLHGHDLSNISNASILRFRKSRSARVASAALDGVSSREAAS